MLEIKTLGGLTILIDGDPAPRLVSRKAEALLVYLAVKRQLQRREALAEMFWPERPQARAMSNLRTVLSSLRKAMGHYTSLGRERIRINVNADVQVDLLTLERELELGRLEAAVSHYKGRFLEGFHLRGSPAFGAWQQSRATAIEGRIVGALETLVRRALADGAFHFGQDWARKLIEHDALNEPAHRALILALTLDGHRSAALEAYRRFESRLDDELGVDPMPETRALHRAILEGTPLDEFLAERASHTTPLDREPESLVVGREREIGELIRLWKNAVSGRGRLAIASGVAGIGKSELVGELAARIVRQNGRVLETHCYEFEHGMPFQPVVELLRSAAEVMPIADLAPVHQAAFSQLAPDLITAADEDVSRLSTGSQLRAQLYEALFQTFLRLAQTQPLLLVFEDVHWATDSTLDWFIYIASRLISSRILLVATYRLHEIDPEHALARLERRLSREGKISILSLEPLSSEANQLLVARLSGLTGKRLEDFASRLYRESSGNPFFLHEIIKGLEESGYLQERDGVWHGPALETAFEIQIHLSESLVETMSARVNRLSEQARMFLQIASVAGRIFDFQTVQHAGGWSEEHALQALEDCLTRGFVQPGEHPVGYAFSHHLIQESIYAGITSARKLYLHRRLADSIQELRPEDVEALVHHFKTAGDQHQAIDYAIQAARRADQVYAYEEAVRYLLLALDELSRQDQRETQVVVLEALADDYRLLRAGEKAVKHYAKALEICNALGGSDPITAARLVRKILQTTSGMWGRAGFGRFEAARKISDQVRDQAADLLRKLEADLPNPEIVWLRRALASDSQIGRFPPDWDSAIVHAEAAVEAAELIDDPVLLSSALATLATVYGAQGQLHERVALSKRRFELAVRPDFQDPRERVRALIGIGSALVHVGEYLDAIRHLHKAENLAGEIRAVDLEARALSLLQQCWFRLDRWEGVDIVDERREALLERYSLTRLGSPCFAIGLSAAVHTMRGNLEKGRALRERSNEIMVGVNGPPEVWSRSPHY